MWALIKFAFGLVIIAVCAYGVFFMDLGDQTMASHFMEIWSAPVVQKKLEGAREGMKKGLEEHLAKMGETAGRSAAREISGATDELTAGDRHSLEDVLRRVSE